MVSAEQLKSAYWKGFAAGTETIHNVSGIRLRSSDGFVLKDADGLYITAKEVE